MSERKVLFCMTGSIACYKACEAISTLAKAGLTVKVVATPSALQFVGKATLEGLSGNSVYTDLYENGRMMEHIHLTRWADLIIVAPATANTLNKLACGLGDDLLSTIFLAHDFKKPFLIAPAMNHSMYSHPVTQQSLQQLSRLGVTNLGVDSGELACGEVGEGRMISPDRIGAAIFRNLTSSADLNVLITGGGTKEAIDPVRFITNWSTGKTALSIADAFLKKGAHVDLLIAEGVDASSVWGSVDFFSSHEDLASKLQQKVKNKFYDVIIHSAAVSDFTVDKPAEKKVDSEHDLKLTFRKTDKIISHIKTWSLNKNVKLMGFKLTSGADKEESLKKINTLFKNSEADFVVHNDFAQISNKKHPFYIYNSDLEMIEESASKAEFSSNLINRFLGTARGEL